MQCTQEETCMSSTRIHASRPCTCTFPCATLVFEMEAKRTQGITKICADSKCSRTCGKFSVCYGYFLQVRCKIVGQFKIMSLRILNFEKVKFEVFFLSLFFHHHIKQIFFLPKKKIESYLKVKIQSVLICFKNGSGNLNPHQMQANST